MELRLGWLVVPLMEAMAPSAISHAGVGGLEDGGGVDAAGVVGVEVNGDADFLAQRLDQRVGGIGPAQAGHVLDGQHMRAHALQFLGHADVVVERILGRGAGSRMSPV